MWIQNLTCNSNLQSQNLISDQSRALRFLLKSNLVLSSASQFKLIVRMGGARTTSISDPSDAPTKSLRMEWESTSDAICLMWLTFQFGYDHLAAMLLHSSSLHVNYPVQKKKMQEPNVLSKRGSWICSHPKSKPEIDCHFETDPHEK